MFYNITNVMFYVYKQIKHITKSMDFIHGKKVLDKPKLETGGFSNIRIWV